MHAICFWNTDLSGRLTLGLVLTRDRTTVVIRPSSQQMEIKRHMAKYKLEYIWLDGYMHYKRLNAIALGPQQRAIVCHLDNHSSV